jgi:serine O-acetyltransferase
MGIAMFNIIRDEIDSMMARDPAARSRLEVVICYPGFQALMIYRLAHGLWRRRWFLLARMFSQLGRMLTGIEIHPGATIGRSLFIDHGMGVVIGESSHIGDGVTLYQGVTLGGVAPSVDSHTQRNAKRHPTLQDGVIVGSGAQILGPITVGDNARVGANSVVTRDVPRCATVVGIPGRIVQANKKAQEEETPGFLAYGLPAGGAPDPVARAIDGLLGEVQSLRARLNKLEEDTASQAGQGANVGPARRAKPKAEGKTRKAEVVPPGEC